MFHVKRTLRPHGRLNSDHGESGFSRREEGIGADVSRETRPPTADEPKSRSLPTLIPRAGAAWGPRTVYPLPQGGRESTDAVRPNWSIFLL